MKKFINKHPWLFVLFVLPTAAAIAVKAGQGVLELAKRGPRKDIVIP